MKKNASVQSNTCDEKRQVKSEVETTRLCKRRVLSKNTAQYDPASAQTQTADPESRALSIKSPRLVKVKTLEYNINLWFPLVDVFLVDVSSHSKVSNFTSFSFSNQHVAGGKVAVNDLSKIIHFSSLILQICLS